MRIRMDQPQPLIRRSSSFTLVELMVAAVILIVALVGALAVLTATMNLAEIARNLTMATNGAQQKLEEMREYDFSQVAAAYSPGGAVGDTFAVAGLDGRGGITINAANPNLLQVRLVVCWRQRSGRILGEDLNLNGRLDGGEDTNGDGQLSSPCEASTLMARR